MIFMITLTLSALLILIAGLMEIKMSFLSKPPETKSKKMSSLKQTPDTNIKEKLVKDSVENTIRNTRFLKHKMNENIF